jgi:hypothetical protein
MTINKLAVLRTYLETISQYESQLNPSNGFGTGVIDKYKKLNRLSTAEQQFNINELRSNLQQRYYQDYYNVLRNSSIIHFLENGEKISNITHLFAYSEIDFPLSFLEKSLAEVDQFGNWLHSQLTLETDCWAVTHEVYRQLNKLRIRIRNLIETKTNL